MELFIKLHFQVSGGGREKNFFDACYNDRGTSIITFSSEKFPEWLTSLTDKYSEKKHIKTKKPFHDFRCTPPKAHHGVFHPQ